MRSRACTFFGHSDCPDTILPRLREAVYELIEKQGVECFFVGNEGSFDRLALRVLRESKTSYPQIRYDVVLAYIPKGNDPTPLPAEETLFPEGIETVPKRFAISWRNRWMIERSEFVICYTTHAWGGAAQFVREAERKHRKIVAI